MLLFVPVLCAYGQICAWSPLPVIYPGALFEMPCVEEDLSVYPVSNIKCFEDPKFGF